MKKQKTKKEKIGQFSFALVMKLRAKNLSIDRDSSIEKIVDQLNQWNISYKKSIEENEQVLKEIRDEQTT